MDAEGFQIYRTMRLRRESRREPKRSCSWRRHRSRVFWSTSASASKAAHSRMSPRINAVGDRGRRRVPLWPPRRAIACTSSHIGSSGSDAVPQISPPGARPHPVRYPDTDGGPDM